MRKKTGKKIKTLPTKPLSDAKSKATKGGGLSIGSFVGGPSKIVSPTVPPPPPVTR